MGIPVLLMRDTCDAWLEFCKILVCLKWQHGKLVHSIERLTRLSFIVFTVLFYTNQLYYFPLFSIYQGTRFVEIHGHNPLFIAIMSIALTFVALDMLWLTVSSDLGDMFFYQRYVLIRINSSVNIDQYCKLDIILYFQLILRAFYRITFQDDRLAPSVAVMKHNGKKPNEKED